MRTSNPAVTTSQPIPLAPGLNNSVASGPGELKQAFEPRSISFPQRRNGHEVLSLKMYTDEEVAQMLQVSLSQLRKRRMKRNRGKQPGPPFKKIALSARK